MSATMLLGTAYGIMGVVGVYAYWPQFRAFWKDPQAALHTPVSTWALWGGQTAVYFLYAVLVNRDPLFVAITTVTVIAVWACFGMLLWQRLRARKNPTIVPLHPVTPTPVAPEPENRAA